MARRESYEKAVGCIADYVYGGADASGQSFGY
jgi:hypothetical protein